MIDQDQINQIKEWTREFFKKMTIVVLDVQASISLMERNSKEGINESLDVVDLDVKIEEPQIIIGQQGQTLFEIQRILRAVLTKKLKNNLYVNLDINDYKKNKIEYLKYLAKDSADYVSSTGQEKSLLPMSSYERRIIHAELSQRTDVVTESSGDNVERHIVIKPK